jgi:hypothetical protein
MPDRWDDAWRTIVFQVSCMIYGNSDGVLAMTQSIVANALVGAGVKEQLDHLQESVEGEQRELAARKEPPQ